LDNIHTVLVIYIKLADFGDSIRYSESN
jgi:hypothetical protein